MSRPDIVIGYGRDNYGRKVAEALECEYKSFWSRYYPEGTPAPCIEADYGEIEGRHVLTVRRSDQFSDMNKVCRFLTNYPRIGKSLADKDTFNAARVDVFHPYFLCGKQDHNPRTDDNNRIRREDAGKDLGYRFEASLFVHWEQDDECAVKPSGKIRLLTVHPHFHGQPGEGFVAGIPVTFLDAIPRMAEYAKTNGLSDDSIILSPDLSGGNGEDDEYIMAKAFAERTGCEFRCQEAKRDSPREKTTAPFDADGRDVAIVDDCAITLSTLSASVKLIENAPNIDVYVANAVLPEEGHAAVRALTRGGEPVRRFVSTDTIINDYARISVIPQIVDYYDHDED